MEFLQIFQPSCAVHTERKLCGSDCRQVGLHNKTVVIATRMKITRFVSIHISVILAVTRCGGGEWCSFREHVWYLSRVYRHGLGLSFNLGSRVVQDKYKI